MMTVRKSRLKEGAILMEKRKSAIGKVVIEGRSYDHEEFEPAREVIYNMVDYYDCVTFYMVRKTDNHSSITIEKAKELSEDDRNVNPVQNAYTAL